MNVYRIVHEHDGSVEIRSEPGRGTRVRMRLPLSQRPVRLLPEETPETFEGLEGDRGESAWKDTRDAGEETALSK